MTDQLPEPTLYEAFERRHPDMMFGMHPINGVSVMQILSGGASSPSLAERNVAQRQHATNVLSDLVVGRIEQPLSEAVIVLDTARPEGVWHKDLLAEAAGGVIDRLVGLEQVAEVTGEDREAGIKEVKLVNGTYLSVKLGEGEAAQIVLSPNPRPLGAE